MTCSETDCSFGNTYPPSPFRHTIIHSIAHPLARSYSSPCRHVRGRDMDPEARQLLEGLYGPYNTRLAEILEDKTFMAWNSPGGEKPKQGGRRLAGSAAAA